MIQVLQRSAMSIQFFFFFMIPPRNRLKVSPERLQHGFKWFSKIGIQILVHQPNKRCVGLLSISGYGVFRCSSNAKYTCSLADIHFLNSFSDPDSGFSLAVI